jgi:hypothetical protein
MKKTIGEDVVDRARTHYTQALDSVNAYLGAGGEKTAADRTKELIAGNPTASELLARGYPQYVAEGVARGSNGGNNS